MKHLVKEGIYLCQPHFRKKIILVKLKTMLSRFGGEKGQKNPSCCGRISVIPTVDHISCLEKNDCTSEAF